LKPYANGSEWYDVEAIQDLKKIDVLIIDGPPGSKNPEARYPALKQFKDKLSAAAIVIIDDVNREGERKLAEDFAKALPNHELTILDHEKGTAIIAPR
jgi:ABC-type sugar transport system substrate-binding protein